ncbi:hypothetical protein [Streptomyces sp. NPDC012466]|uniref:hypothetical protein n=1 Tax=Streptomyces sp. NPDC012466 TaxID=3364835 RepID=UPI0036EDD35A
MTGTVLVAIPCRVVTLRMELGPEDGASTLEELVLRAVAAGRRTVRDLGALFSLPNRLVLDVVHGLWSSGLLAVDFSTNTLVNTQAAQSVLSEHDGGGAAASTLLSRRFLFDPVTAAVLPHREGMDRVPYGAVAMPPARGISETDIPQADLLRAVREAVRTDQRRHGERRRVLNVSFANPLLGSPEALHWSTVEVTVNRDPTTGLVTATPERMPQGWGRRAVQLFQARVGELVRSRPDSKFVQQLLSREVLAVVPPESLRSMIVGLDQRAEGLTTIPFDQMSARHEELSSLASRVNEQLAEARRARCSVSAVAPGAGVGWVLTHLIESTAQQLVMALPHITYDALHRILHSLELAAKRGVTLVFLWGSHQSAQLEGKVATALYDLHARFPGHVLLEERSSSSSASVVISDNRYAYVGSHSVLATNTGAGVLVEPAEGSDEPPDCITELLSWARRTYPYWEAASNIALLPTDFDRRQRGVRLPSATVGPRHDVPLPTLTETWKDDEVESRTKWSADWGRALRELTDAVEGVYRGAPVVRAVWDGLYVDLVHNAIGGATECLAVTDDSAETEACTDALGRQLLRLRDKNVTVHLQHPPLKDGHRPAKAYADLLTLLSAERTLRTTKARARAVLSDFETIVGSYRPLGNRSINPTRGQPPTELGLHIMNSDFAADFARELGIPDWFGVADTAGPPAYLPPLPSVSAVPADYDDWTLLDDRLNADTPPERLRREAAVLLRRSQDGGERRRTWGLWLLYDAWQRNAFMEAYLLASLLGDGEEMPVDLAAVAVPLEHGPLGEQLYFSALELGEAGPGHRTVAVVGAVAEMLLHGGDVGLLVWEEVMSGPGPKAAGPLPSTWRRLAHQAAACFRETRAPVPLPDINAWADAQERSAEVRLGWERLAAGARDFERTDHRFKFQDGQRMHRAMFRPGGVFAGLLDMAKGKATTDFRTQTAAELPRTSLDARVYMDQLATDLGLRKVEWSHHLSYARRIAELMAEAHRLARLSAARDERGTTGSGPAMLPRLETAQLELARFLDREWHNLLDEADGLGKPALYPAKALLSELASMPVVGREDT